LTSAIVVTDAAAVAVGSAAVLTGTVLMNQNQNDAYKAADEQYPSKVGKIEAHHETPQYLGGAADGPTVNIPASYHQLITNAFRSLWKYG